MTAYNGRYDIKEAVRKVAVATAYRALFLEDNDQPSGKERMIGLAIAVALFYNLDEQMLDEFIFELREYVRTRKEESLYRDPALYE